MEVNVQTPNFAVDQKLVGFITNKLLKLELFYGKIIAADVFLKVQKTREKENKIVSFTFWKSWKNHHFFMFKTASNHST